MNKKRGYTTRQLLRQTERDGVLIRPVFRTTGKVCCYEPRTKYDPMPWTDGFFRYHAWELAPSAN